VSLEVIVVDDGSTDGGAEVAACALPTVRLLHSPRSGAPQARNVGLSEAQGEFLLLLDSDDLVEPGLFTSRVAALRAHATASAAYGPFEFFRGEGEFKEELIHPRHEAYPLETVVARESHLWRLLAGWYIPPPTMLWRTATVRALGGHDVTLRINQDVDLLFRALLRGSGIIGCSGARGLYRSHDTPDRQGAIGSDRAKAGDVLRLRRRPLSPKSFSGCRGLSIRTCRCQVGGRFARYH
jgi:glycosyltransferase involved in cell wall biosynthesis